MARRFLTDIDLTGFKLLGALLHPVSSDPSGLGTSDAGRVWFNSTTNKLMVWNGTAAIDFLSRGNHSGTQLAATISDFAAAVQAIRWASMLAPNAAVDMGGQRNTNLADPSSAQDSATKNYVDTQLAGLQSGMTLKGAVRVAATTNINIASAPSAIDGITLTNGDQVLLTGQTTASANGPYTFNGAGSAMTRATNWNTTAKATLGSFWVVEMGTNADTFALLTNDSTVTLDTTALTFTFRGTAGATYTAGNGLQLAGSSFSVLLRSASGLLVDGSGLGVDTTVVGRKVTGTIPATTSGIFSVSGNTVTINHGLANSAPHLTVRGGSSPQSGFTQGQLVEVDSVASDANNLVVTLPAAPTANAWNVTIVG